MRNSAIFIVGAWLASVFIVVLGFNNCSEQKFTTLPSKIAEELSEGGGIEINNGDEFTRFQTVQLSLLFDDAVDMYITNDPSCKSGGTWEPVVAHKNWVLGQNNKKTGVYVRFRNSDNIKSKCLSDDIVHDNIPPQASIIDKPPQYSNIKTVNFKIGAVDATSGVEALECTELDQDDFSSCALNLSRSVTAEGTHVFKVRAKDKAGNTSQVVSHAWLADWTPPTVAFHQTPPKITSAPSADFNFSGSDNLSGIENIECVYPGAGAQATCNSGELTLSQLTSGPYEVEIRATDKAGNFSEWLKYEWTVDTTKPSVIITSHPEVYSNTGQARFEFEGMDNGQPITKFKCQIDGQTLQDCTSGVTYQLNEGQHTFAVVGYDMADNASEPATYAWLIDTTKPVVSWVSVPPAYDANAQTQLTFQVSENGSGVQSSSCQLDGQPINCDNYSIAANGLDEGAHQAQVVVTDKSGNTSNTLTHAWVVDLTPPSVQITQTPASVTKLASAEFAFTASDNLSPIKGYECQVDTLGYQSCDSPHEYQNLNEGAHLFAVIAEDAAGNKSTPATYNWIADLSGPDIILVQKPVSHGYGSEDTLQYRVEDPYSQVQSVQCGYTGQLSSCSVEKTISFGVLTPGTYSYTITAQDSLGNLSSATVTWTVQGNIVDKTQQVTVYDGDSSTVDILFVVDNSGSMEEEQNELGQRIAGFIDKISDLDYQIGVTSTDPNSSTRNANNQKVYFSDGRLRELGTGSKILKTTDSNKQSLLASALYMGGNGSGTERGINASYRLIQRGQADANSAEAKLIRDNAALSVVLLSDEDECSNGCSSSAQSSDPEKLVQLVQNTYGANKKFTFNSIIWRPGTACSTGYNVGHTYKMITTLTNGELGDICASNYTDQLNKIGQSVVDLVKSVQLDCEPLDLNNDSVADIVVTDTNQNPLTLNFVVNGSRLEFATALDPGVYNFAYSCLQ